MSLARMPWVHLRPLVGLPAVLAHVGPDAGGDVVVDEPDLVDLDAVLAHDRGTGVDETLGVADLGALLQRAVDEGGLQAGEVVVHGALSRACTADRVRRSTAARRARRDRSVVDCPIVTRQTPSPSAARGPPARHTPGVSARLVGLVAALVLLVGLRRARRTDVAESTPGSAVTIGARRRPTPTPTPASDPSPTASSGPPGTRVIVGRQRVRDRCSTPPTGQAIYLFDLEAVSAASLLRRVRRRRGRRC